MTPFRQVIGLAIWVAMCFVVAALGSLATYRAIPEWYAGLAKPTWTPPSWVFGPVWTLLYLMMGTAAWLVWRPAGFAAAALPLSIFMVQLALNGLWSMVFFGLHQPGLAFVTIVLLWLAILSSVLTFWRAAPIAGVLLVPYILWVSYAAGLNLAIWRMNR